MNREQLKNDPIREKRPLQVFFHLAMTWVVRVEKFHLPQERHEKKLLELCQQAQANHFGCLLYVRYRFYVIFFELISFVHFCTWTFSRSYHGNAQPFCFLSESRNETHMISRRGHLHTCSRLANDHQWLLCRSRIILQDFKGEYVFFLKRLI